MSKRITDEEILALQNRIAAGETTVFDVDLMIAIIKQITREVTGNDPG